MAELLIKQEVITRKDIEQILGKRPMKKMEDKTEIYPPKAGKPLLINN